MNMMVSAATLSVAAPLTNTSTSTWDLKQQLARLEHAVETLRVSHDCALDKDAAERALQYFRDGAPDDDDRWSDTIWFIKSHGLSFDWILAGKLEGMISGFSKYSEFSDSCESKPEPKAGVGLFEQILEAWSAADFETRELALNQLRAAEIGW